MIAAASCICGREGRGCAWLVVILQETGELVLIVEAGEQMLPHGSGMAFAQAIVEPLVVGVVEPLLLHSPLEIPIDFSHEAEPGACSRTRRVVSGQKSGARRPHVRSNTSGRTSIAMSHRTPSHCPAILRSSPRIASCVAGLL